MEQPLQEDPEEEAEIFTSLGSSTHMQQVLSVFFHAFFVAGDGREMIALESITDLVSDVCSMTRYGDINGSVLYKVVSQFISLCDSSSSTTASVQTKVRQHLFAAISREILKSSPGKSDKVAIKEFVKALSILSPSKWIQSAAVVPTVNKVVTAVYKMTQDKVSLKTLEKISDECSSLFDDAVLEELSADQVTEGAESFFICATGLADLMEMEEGAPAQVLADLSAKAAQSKPAAGGMARPKLIPRTPAKKNSVAESDDDENGEIEMEEEGDNCRDNDDEMETESSSVVVEKATSRPGRSSKAKAQNKISAQMTKENTVGN